MRRNAVDEVLWHLACPLEGRTEVRFENGCEPANSWHGPDGHCTLSRNLRRILQKGLRGPFAADPSANSTFQRFRMREDRLFTLPAEFGPARGLRARVSKAPIGHYVAARGSNLTPLGTSAPPL